LTSKCCTEWSSELCFTLCLYFICSDQMAYLETIPWFFLALLASFCVRATSHNRETLSMGWGWHLLNTVSITYTLQLGKSNAFLILWFEIGYST
jgi:hypothetical protein